MKAASRVLIFFIAISFFLVDPSLAANTPPVHKGIQLPSISLPTPKNPDEKRYLGLTGSDDFKISQIEAKAVILKIFSLYCPICQSTASEMVELYHKIENHPDLRDKMKLIGIGVGNSSYEVGVFKDIYQIPFPLFPDEDFSIHKALGEVRTPYTFTIRIGGGTHQVVHTQSGGIGKPEEFLGLALKACGIVRDDLPGGSVDFATWPQQPQSY